MANYPCPECDKIFTKSYSLKRHMTNIHKVHHKISRRAIQCPYPSCFEKFPYIPPMKNHLSLHHGITLFDQTLTFNSMKDFFDWKAVEESRSRVKYIKACGIQRLLDGTEVNRFNCNRTGTYTPEGKGLRRLKTKGSCKMGASCPSTMTANRRPDDTVSVSFCLTHVGHDTPEADDKLAHRLMAGDVGAAEVDGELGAAGDPPPHVQHQFVLPDDVAKVFAHYDIPDEERPALSTCLRSATMTDEAMLDVVYKLADPNMAAACEKLTTELDAIVHSPCLQNGEPSAGGLFAVPDNELYDDTLAGGGGDGWREDNPIVLYQPEVEPNDDYNDGEHHLTNQIATTDDFLLVIVNSVQAQVLHKFGHQGTVYLDAIHGASHSVLCLFVLDQRGRSFLCALCACRRIDAQVLLMFLVKVRSRAGQVTPKVLMSDGHEWVHQTWVQVMGETEQWLHSLWWTDAAWRQHLLLCLRVDDDRATCVAIHWHLCRLLKSDSKQRFCQIRSSLLSCMVGGRYRTTVSPSKYFEKTLCQKLDNWAWCFRSATLRNLAVQMEATHGAVSQLCLQGEGQAGLAPALFSLYQHYRRRSFVYMADTALRTISMQATDHQHRLSNNLLGSGNVVTLSQLGEEPVWLVELENDGSDTTPPRHTIQRVTADCPETNCFARCDSCAACVHEYECSCVSSAIQWRMCKHAHFVSCHRGEVAAEVAARLPTVIDDDENIVDVVTQVKRETNEETEATATAEEEQQQQQLAARVETVETADDSTPRLMHILDEIREVTASIFDSARRVTQPPQLLQLRDALHDVAELAAAMLQADRASDAGASEETDRSGFVADGEHTQAVVVPVSFDHDYAS